MNRTEKRQLDLRNKLVAAVAMLLVSCIMMVSATYAWFTLSTAPEVQGITTTVGANGNLEIALSPYSGNESGVTSNMGDALKTWDEKNLTWGNLLNLENNSIYGLNDVKLLPAKLNLTGNAQSGAYVGTAPLSTPIYGADGRPSKLEANTSIGSKYDINGEPVNGFGATTPGYGVRVVGTSDSMTDTQIAFNEALANLANAISNSNTAAANSLSNHGTTLAGVMINYGLGNTVSYVAKDIAEVQGIVTELGQSNAYLLTAIKAALMAEAAAAPEGDDATFDEDKFTASKLLTNADITAVKAYVAQYTVSVNGLSNAITVYENVNTNLTSAQGKLDPLVKTGTATFAQLQEVLNYVMNTNGVTVNGWTAAQLADKEVQGKFIASIANQGVNIKMGVGCGIYAELSSAIGNITTKVAIPAFTYNDTPFSSDTVEEEKLYANMSTASATAGGYMTVTRTAIAGMGAYAGTGTGSAVINVPYAYMIDFMFRTNAQGSSLKLQTSDAQRVYTDSESAATQGMGSEMVFNVTDALNLKATVNLMKSIRVVFMDTATNQIYGIGKLDVTSLSAKDADGASVTVVVGTDGSVTASGDVATLTANLYLYSYEFEEIMETVTTVDPETQQETTTTTGTDKYNLVVSNTKIEESAAVLCSLPANTAKKITSMVYLDGDSVTNADVANGDVSLSGALNLQFASTAVLVPMENTALKDMEVKDPYTATVTLNGTNLGTTELNETSYSGEIKDFLTGHTDVNVVVKMGGEVVDGAWDASSQKITISEVTGNVEVIITSTPPTQG